MGCVLRVCPGRGRSATARERDARHWSSSNVRALTVLGTLRMFSTRPALSGLKGRAQFHRTPWAAEVCHGYGTSSRPGAVLRVCRARLVDAAGAYGTFC